MRSVLRTIVVIVTCFAMALVASPLDAQERNGPDSSIDTKTKSDTIDGLVKALHDNYVFPDVGDKVTHMLKERQRRQEYDQITSGKDFSELLTKQMHEIAHDEHLRVIYRSQQVPVEPASGAGTPPEPPSPEMLLREKKSNYGFEGTKILRGNIGYLKVNEFSPDAVLGGATAAAAMTFLSHTYALIIDLRENHGGAPGMVDVLASYFLSGNFPVHLNDLSWRHGGRTELNQFWALPYVPGDRYLNKDVFILTSHQTFSAAEEFTYDLQALKRATIVGESTGGGANPGWTIGLGDHFRVFLPTGTAINPITKTNWEGRGVTPDISVPKETALNSAHATALQHLLEKKTDERDIPALRESLAAVQAETPANQASSLGAGNSETKMTSAPNTSSDSSSDLSGIWTGQITGPAGDAHDITLNLRVNGNKVTGTISGAPPTGEQTPIEQGAVDRNQITFKVTGEGPGGNNVSFNYKGDASGNQIMFHIGGMFSADFEVTRKQF